MCVLHYDSEQHVNIKSQKSVKEAHEMSKSMCGSEECLLVVRVCRRLATSKTEKNVQKWFIQTYDDHSKNTAMFAK